jgi:hypothetical protein
MQHIGVACILLDRFATSRHEYIDAGDSDPSFCTAIFYPAHVGNTSATNDNSPVISVSPVLLRLTVVSNEQL